MKRYKEPSLADSVCDVRVRKIKIQFFQQINTVLDWDSISKTIDQYYSKGTSATGQPSYDGLLLAIIENQVKIDFWRHLEQLSMTWTLKVS